MELITWIIVFIVSLVILIKGADWLINSAEKIGLALGLSPFVVGIIIVGVGTSLPELISSLFGALKGAADIVNSNAVGSNITNILLIVGISSLLARKLIITKNIIDLDLPILVLSTVIYLLAAYDKVITVLESVILVSSFVVYLFYSMHDKPAGEEKVKKEKISIKTIGLFIVGLVFLLVGANYVVDSVINISSIIGIPVSIISITAIAVGTSLPELVVSAKAAINKKYDLSIGNIFGSNAFNVLMVVGIPGLLGNMKIDDVTYSIGLLYLIISTFLFLVSGISRTIHKWEGMMFIVIYLLFLFNLVNIT